MTAEMGSGPAEPRVVVTGTGLVCPVATSVPALLDATGSDGAAGSDGTAGRAGAGGSEAEDGVDWFDPVPFLGARGWKYLTPATRYLLSAATLAMADADFDPGRLPDEGMGVVVGTNFAAAGVVARFDDVIAAETADGLSPAEAPNFSINIAASHISMRHGMRAFNLTLTNPMVAGLESLLTLRAAIRRGRAQAGIAGACEERPSTATAASALGAAVARDGACCFVLERLADTQKRGGRPGVEIAGGFSLFAGAAAEPSQLARMLARPLAALVGPDPGPVPYVPPVGSFSLGSRVDELCTGWAADAGVELVRRSYPGAAGCYFTVSPLLQVAGLIAEHGHGLVLAASPHGQVAGVYLRSSSSTVD